MTRRSRAVLHAVRTVTLISTLFVATGAARPLDGNAAGQAQNPAAGPPAAKPAPKPAPR